MNKLKYPQISAVYPDLKAIMRDPTRLAQLTVNDLIDTDAGAFVH